LLTCKDFLRELSEFLDESTDPQTRQELEQHMSQCPNCFVVFDTTRRTVHVYKGMEPKALPTTMSNRLMEALRRKMESKKCQPHESALGEPNR
jgi:anti-sigma factor RsiW